MPKLELKQVRKNIKLKIRVSSLELRDLTKGFYSYIIDYDVYLPTKNKNLQRAFVWTLEQRQELIISILKGIEIPTVSVIMHTDDMSDITTKTLKVIDGKQRISAVLSFVENEFPIVVDNQEYFFNDLADDAAYLFRSFMFRCNLVYEYPDDLLSDDDKIAWFEMINFAGTPQDKEHLVNLKS